MSRAVDVDREAVEDRMRGSGELLDRPPSHFPAYSLCLHDQ